MTKITIAAEGQVLLSGDMLEHLGLVPGEKIAASKLPNGRIELKADHQTGKIIDIFGAVRRDGRRSLSIRRMSKVAARGWAGER